MAAPTTPAANPTLHIIARTRHVTDVPELERLGADEVVPEELETSVEIFARVMREFGVASDAVRRRVAEIRAEGYEQLRSSSSPLVSGADGDVVASFMRKGEESSTERSSKR